MPEFPFLKRWGIDKSALRFLTNLGWIGVSFGIAKALSSISSLLMARAIGPTEYGRVNLVTSIGGILAAFMVVGLNASMVRYGSAEKDRYPVISSVAYLEMSISLLIAGLAFLFRGPLAALFGVDRQVYFFSLGYALSYNVYYFATSVLQSLERFRLRGWLEIIFAGSYSILLLLGLHSYVKDYTSVSWIYLVTYSLVGIVGVISTMQFLSPKFVDRSWIAPLMKYGLYNFGSVVGYFLTSNFQKLILNRFLTVSDVGLYSAYSNASSMFASYVNLAIGTVLFQRASASTNRLRLWRIVSRAFGFLSLPIIFVFGVLVVLVLMFLGKQHYAIESNLVVLFSLLSYLVVFQGSLGQVFVAGEMGAIRFGLKMSISLGVVSCILGILLIPHLRIAGAVVAQIVIYVLSIAWMWSVKGRYLTHRSS